MVRFIPHLMIVALGSDPEGTPQLSEAVDAKFEAATVAIIDICSVKE